MDLLSRMGSNSQCIAFGGAIICMLLLQIGASVVVNAVGEPSGFELDTQGLLSFKQIIEKDPYGVLDGWAASTSNCCEWRGVSCSNGRVVGIDLNHGGLVAPLPVATLAALDQLQELRLSGNEFYGYGTEQLVASACSTLTVLDLSSNNLTGSFTGSSKVLCTRLAYLNLSRNAYRGTLGNFGIVGTGSSIAELDLSFNNYSGLIPSHFFSDCGSLAWLDLSHNSLSGGIPAWVSLCSSLVHLDLSYNLLKSSLPPDIIISNTTSSPPPPTVNSTAGLTYLNLSSNQLFGHLPDALHSAVLTSLDLSSNFFTGPIPPSLSSSISLTLLNLSSNSLTGPLPRSLSNLVKLQGLYLADNSLTGPIPPEFGIAFTSIEELDLSLNQLVGSIPASFSNCSSLYIFNLGHNFLSGEFPKDVICSMPALQTLHLSFNNLTGTLPAGGLPNCKLLTMLDLSANELEGSVPGDFCAPQLQQLLLQDNSFNGLVPAGLGNCTSLTILDLSCNHLSGPLPPSLPSQLLFLSELMMWGNSLTGPIPPGFGSALRLRKLILNLNRLSSTIPVTLANCTNLEWLSLSSNLLTGVIPPELGSLPRIGILQLANNSLSGPIPATLGNATMLVWLDLNSNLLEGSIPVELANQAGKVRRGTLDQGTEYAFLKNLGSCAGLGGLLEYSGIRDGTLFQLSSIKGSCNVTRLYFGTNPYYFDTFGSLQYLDLGYNKLSGTIPQEIGSFSYLLVLSLSYNSLTGPIPDTLSNLLRMTILYLDHNMLSGPIPPSLAKLGLLNQLNLANNNLSGPIPETGTMSTMPASVFANNPGLCGAPLLPCGYTPTSDNSSSSTGGNADSRSSEWSVVAIVMSSIGGLVIACMSGMAACFLVHRHKMRKNIRDNYMDNLPSSGRWNISGASEPLSINVATFEKPLRKLTFAKLLEATNGFSKDAIIGQGGFGDVYKATLEGGKVVAIKKLIHTVGQGDREFMAEMETIGKIKHRNLVPLLGYCKVGQERLLVYEYMDGGSLDKRLHGDCSDSHFEATGSSPEHQEHSNSIFNWEMRKRIALGTARGLCFLHHSCIPHIIHRDLKSSNILLDDTSEARVSDFGMARLVSAAETHLSVSSIVGTPGYVPPEYCNSFRCTAKGDVYSFGVVLLELVTGRRPTWSSSSNCTRSKEPVLSESQTSASPSTSVSDGTSTSTTTATPNSTTPKKIELEEGTDHGIDLVGWVKQHRKEGKGKELLDQRVLNGGGTLMGISPPSWVVEKEMLRYLDIACRCVEQSHHRRPTMLQVMALFRELHPVDAL